MITKDRDLIFEAYKSVKPTQNLMLMKEMSPPTEPGESWNTDVATMDVKPSETGKYFDKKIPFEFHEKAVKLVIKKVKDFLDSQKNKTYPGVYDQKTGDSFRNEVSKIIRQTFPVIDIASSGYAARKIQNFLVSANIIKDERAGKRRVTQTSKKVTGTDIENMFKDAFEDIGGTETQGTSAPEPGDKQAADLKKPAVGLGGLEQKANSPATPSKKPPFKK